MIKLISSLILIVLIVITFDLNAQESSDETFADYLFGEGEYYRAVTEYYKVLYLESDYQRRAIIIRKMGLCYFYGADYDGYISFMKKNQSSLSVDSAIKADMNLKLGESYYHLNHYRKTINHLDSVLLDSRNQYYNDSQFLRAISFSRLYNWQSAISELGKVNQENSELDRIKADNMIRSLENFQNQSPKNPFLAGGLSAIIPGSGYAYCHHWGTGIASFVINGLLVWAFADAWKNEQYGIASLTGFVGIGWYIGNIRGSAKAAKRYNSRIREDFINGILMRENFLQYVKN